MNNLDSVALYSAAFQPVLQCGLGGVKTNNGMVGGLVGRNDYYQHSRQCFAVGSGQTKARETVVPTGIRTGDWRN